MNASTCGGQWAARVLRLRLPLHGFGVGPRGTRGVRRPEALREQAPGGARLARTPPVARAFGLRPMSLICARGGRTGAGRASGYLAAARTECSPVPAVRPREHSLRPPASYKRSRTSRTMAIASSTSFS